MMLRFCSNGGSIPPRTPDLSRVMKGLENQPIKLTIVALSYRGYWTSKGSASEKGIRLDAAAALSWIADNYPQASIMLWGQSIGAGVATMAAVEYPAIARSSTVMPFIDALILETPFTSIGDMLTALYPQKWLPYRYLHPFLWSHWDSREALQIISQRPKKPKVLILAGERDEVVPAEHAGQLETVCRDGQIPVTHLTIQGALHHEVLMKAQGRNAIVSFLISLGSG